MCRARVVVVFAVEPAGGGEVCVTVALCCREIGFLFGAEGSSVLLELEAWFCDL